MANDREVAAGCGMAVLTLFVQLPLWAALMFGVLMACQPDIWVWVLFWCYVPVSFVMGGIRIAVEAIAKME